MSTNNKKFRKKLLFTIKNFELGKGQLIRFTGWTTDVMIIAIFFKTFLNINLTMGIIIPSAIVTIVILERLGAWYLKKDLKKIEAEYENEQNNLSIQTREMIYEFKQFRETFDRFQNNFNHVISASMGGKM